MVGWQVLSRPSAAEGGGRRPAFTGPATQPYSATEVDGWQQLSRVSQNRAAVQSPPVENTIGMAVVAAFAASVAGVPLAIITATRRRTRSAASAGSRSYWISA